MMDLSCVQASSTLADIEDAVALARQHTVAAIFALPAHVPYLIDAAGGDIVIGATVGFPDGAATTAGKAAETKEQLAFGCGEFDMVNNIAWLKAGKDDLYRNDVAAVVEAAEGKPVKVILECHHLADAEIVRACELCIEAGAAFVKTGTGWAPTGATLENIKLMKQTVGDRCQVKAAGGVRGLETMLAMHKLGATRFGIGLGTARKILENISASAGEIDNY
jgi:deoxyribose-phosphate aldolase